MLWFEKQWKAIGASTVLLFYFLFFLPWFNAFFFQDWIYRQLCETSTPLHPQLLPLIDVYINSILTPASKSNPEATNQPVTEQEILNIFQEVIGVNKIMLLLHLLHFCLSPYFSVLRSLMCDSDFKIRLMHRYAHLHTQLQIHTYYIHTVRLNFISSLIKIYSSISSK